MAIDNAQATIQIEAGKPVEMPSGDFVANAEFTREGHDLHMSSPDGQHIIVEGYFAQLTPPDIVTTDGAFLSPEMVDAFLPPQYVGQYAQASTGTAVDVSPAGQITEVVGSATIVRADGTKVPATVGTAVFPGDVVETTADGAVNILFADNTTFAISESARLSVDEFHYNASEQEGSSFFSMLQGVFVYTSGMIGKNDPGNVNIETPVGSIGIRGTVVAGDIKPAGQESQITIVDGAIVLTNQGGTLELNQSFETARVSSYTQQPSNMGQIDTASFSSSYQSIAAVVPTFSSMGNASPANAAGNGGAQDGQSGTENARPDGNDAAPAPEGGMNATPPTQAPQQQAPQAAPPADGQQGTQVMPPAPIVQPVMVAPPAPPAGGAEFGSGTGSTFGGPGDYSGTVAGTVNTPGAAGTGTGPGTVAVAPPPPPPPPANNGSETAGTGTGTGGTAPVVNNPPPPPPPPPELNFAFSGQYKNFTMPTFDDGINLFGTGWTVGSPVGMANLQNYAGAVTYHLNYLDHTGTWQSLTSSGNVMGIGMSVGAGMISIMKPMPIFYFDAANGRITLLDKNAMALELNGNLRFKMAAVDGGGAIIDETNEFIFRMDNFDTAAFTGIMTSLAVTSPNIILGNEGPGSAGTITDYVITGNGTITPIAQAMDENVPTLSSSNRWLFSGTGDDKIMINNGGAGSHVFAGYGDDQIILGMTGGNIWIDGGSGMDTLKISGSFDFSQPNREVRSIEKLMIINGGSVRLDLQDIFQMTENGQNSLHIMSQNGTNANSMGNLDIDVGAFTVANGAIGSGQVTLVHTNANNVSVTLIIEQGSVSPSDGVNIV